MQDNKNVHQFRFIYHKTQHELKSQFYSSLWLWCCGKTLFSPLQYN